jgi:hypothetical protein
MAYLSMKRSKKSKNIWISQGVSFSDTDLPGTGQASTLNVHHQAFDVRGPAYTSALSYMPTMGSPRKPSANQAGHEIHWNFEPVPEAQGHDDGLWMDPDYVSHIEDLTGLPPKRKRTAGVSFHVELCKCYLIAFEDDPLSMFMPEVDSFLREFLRLEGRGDHTYLNCPNCETRAASIRCEDCFNGNMWCQDCTIDSHKHSPLHRVWVCVLDILLIPVPLLIAVAIGMDRQLLSPFVSKDLGPMCPAWPPCWRVLSKPQGGILQRFHYYRLSRNTLSRPRFLQLRICSPTHHSTTTHALVSFNDP